MPFIPYVPGKVEAEQYVEIWEQASTALSRLGYGNRLELLFQVQTRGGKKGVLYYLKDKQTGKIYESIPEFERNIREQGNDIRNSRSREKNVDKNAKPVTPTRGARLTQKTNEDYVKRQEQDISKKRSEYQRQISQYNSKRGAKILALNPNVRMSTVFMYINPNGSYMECETFESAKSWADRDIIVVNGKPWDKNAYNYVKHSSEDIGDAIYHCLIDDDFMNLRMSQLRG